MNAVLTNNYYTHIRSYFFGDDPVKGTLIGSGHSAAPTDAMSNLLGTLISLDGTERTSIHYNKLYNSYNHYDGLIAVPFSAFNTDNSGYTYFSVGSGNTAATANDYCLSNPINSGVTISLSALLFGDSDSGTLRFNVSVTNSGSNDITIQEIGLNKKLAYNSGSSGGSYYFSWDNFLFARCVLDSAVTISAGENTVFTVDITL